MMTKNLIVMWLKIKDKSDKQKMSRQNLLARSLTPVTDHNYFIGITRSVIVDKYVIMSENMPLQALRIVHELACADNILLEYQYQYDFV